MPHRIIIRNAAVITVDDQIGDFSRADILIEDDQIAAVGPDISVSEAEEVDAGQMIAIPGLVDTHRHTWQTPLRGIAYDYTLKQYFTTLFDYGAEYRPEDMYIANLHGALEALDGGITCMLDWNHALNSPDHSDEAIRALKDSGQRAIFAHGQPAIDFMAHFAESILPHDEDVKRVRQQHFSSDDNLVTMMLAARGADFATDETAAEEIRLARDLGLRITMHSGVGMWGKYQKAVTRMNNMGLLGPDITYIHANFLSDEELQMVADTGGSVSVSSKIEIQMGLGDPRTGRLQELGITTCLSIDTCSGTSGSMFDEMRACVACERMTRDKGLLAKDIDPEQVALHSKDVLRMATLEGARACGLDHKIGSITPGKQADIVLLRRDMLNIHPVNNLHGAVAMAASAQNVDTVFVAGKKVKEGGVLLHHDLAQIFEKTSQTRDYIFDKVGIPNQAFPV